ncbi:1-deoxy-D-xylulose-5-phosphate reductoisomerase [Rhodohalobacter sp. SW132]|uniref:1-deoxy-D-xylulose-5-phosphate reductoisomerase n=1 Tax=Rhodohalobacter sp. SW132 TaxID=2293433 RepID=UPI000E28952A|nr:1-deoxy-D-xylulose-5-phosphate reductoisomerase [Rhodohalobacter sp. SW132]REL38206.1 1-deoxy-D-xylulose-5-phosphate reductoisomerase [Rhodohalobacter sp. SW132]
MKSKKDGHLPKKITVLGSTGSIGTQALEIISNHPDKFTVTGLSANQNWKRLAEQVNKFKPKRVLLADEKYRTEFESALSYRPDDILYGPDSLTDLAIDDESDLLLNALVGFSGFMSTYEALKSGKKVALANKESLVVGGELLSNITGFQELLVPVDSEHSAMWQCLTGERAENIARIIITASGGPFRTFSKDEMHKITVEDALNHPNWEMGQKITIDSSTMMNKGLEIIEAHWLYEIDLELIEPVIHPQSIIHSIVEFVDGSSKAQLGPPDMKVPILYALTHPERINYENPVLDYNERMSLTFEPVDMQKFPCVGLAVESAKEGGIMPAVMNAANEVAVDRFLNREIRYIEVSQLIEKALNKFHHKEIVSPQTLLEVDRETRKFANKLLM